MSGAPKEVAEKVDASPASLPAPGDPRDPGPESWGLWGPRWGKVAASPPHLALGKDQLPWKTSSQWEKGATGLGQPPSGL